MDSARLAEIRERVRSARPMITFYGPTAPVVTLTATDLADLLAELDRTTADLAVAAEVARERGQEVERLRKVARWADSAIDVLAQDSDSDLDDWFIAKGVAAVRALQEGP